MEYILLIRLILAHLISDFVLQPTIMAKEKDSNGFSSSYLYLHILITGVIALILVWNTSYVLPVVIITILHGLTDGIKGELNKRFLEKPEFLKQSFKQSFLFKHFYSKISALSLFLFDQIFHILILGVMWILMTNESAKFWTQYGILLQSQKFWLYLLGYTWITVPNAIIIGKVTDKWNSELNAQQAKDECTQDAHTSAPEKKVKSGLTNAGKWIGIIERILILTFVLNRQFAAIGFMLTAKSVFRFGDLKDGKDHKKTEYIIIGTFLSFMLSIITGIVINYLTM